MEKENTEAPTSSNDAKVIHVKVIGGTHADIYEIGKAMKEFKSNLPFKLEAIVSDENVTLRDVDTLIKELQKLQRIERKKDAVSDLSK